MLDEIYIRNDVRGNRIHLSTKNTQGFILESVNFKWVPGEFGTNKAVGQIGVNLSEISLDAREPVIIGWIVGSSVGTIEQYKAIMNRLVNPTQALTIFCYDTYQISGNPDSTVKYGETEQENNEYMCKFMIQMYCADPCFYEDQQRSRTLALWDAMWHFPWVIPLPDGMQFGHRRVALVGTIENLGDVEIGMIVEFSAVGELTNPYLINLQTQEEMKLLTEMSLGDVIRIDTRFGKKTIELISKQTPIPEDISQSFDYPDSTYLQLHEGGNVLRYGADENEQNLQVHIIYYPRFLEVQK